MDIDRLTQQIIGAAYQVHNTLGHGFLEKVYENALSIELCQLGLNVKQQAAIPVRYRGLVVGDFYADLIVNDCVIVELKAVRQLAKEHEVQVVNYLHATGMEIGLLLNFGVSVDIKRKFKTWQPGSHVD